MVVSAVDQHPGVCIRDGHGDVRRVIQGHTHNEDDPMVFGEVQTDVGHFGGFKSPSRSLVWVHEYNNRSNNNQGACQSHTISHDDILVSRAEKD